MWDFDQPFFEGKLIPAEEAWRAFEAWRGSGKEIGVWFVGKGGSLRALGTVKSARDGRVELRGPAARAAFNLRDATFTYGPFQIFPRYPLPPMVEVMAVQAFLTTGEWLVMAEGMKPESIAPRALPA